MTKQILVFTIIIMLFILPSLMALNINIKTLPEHRISLIIREAGKLTSLESYHQDTGNGNLSIVAIADREKIDIILTLKKDGVTIINEKFSEISTNDPLFIDFIPGEVELSIGTPVGAKSEVSNKSSEETTNETVVNNTEELIPSENSEETPEVTETSSFGKITGAAISNVKSAASSKTTYYIIGGIFIIAVFFFITMAMRKRLSSKSENIKITKLSDRISSDKDEEAIAEAERKIEETKKELDDIKNKKGRIKEAQEKLRRDQEELRMLEEGE